MRYFFSQGFRRLSFLLFITCLLAPTRPALAAGGDGDMLVYIGTYTGDRSTSKGIYVAHFKTATGSITTPELAAEISSPSFLAVHPTRRFIYAVNEVSQFNGKDSGAVTAFSIDPNSGKATLLNQESSVGAGPCYLIVDRLGKNVLVANYGSGSVAVLGIQTNGSLTRATAFVQHHGSSIDPDRQKEPHAHSINLDAANRFAIAADLGLDKLLVYRFDPAKGQLAANEPPSASVRPGAGPRHFAFHPNGRFAYVINEMQLSITGFRYDADRGALQELQTVSTLPPGTGETTSGYSTAEVQVHPSGKFLYGSNRGHNSIIVFSVDPGLGTLTYVEHKDTQGKTPRNFGIDPTGRYLLAANQDSDSIVVFRIDARTGRLEPTGARIEVGSPVCVKFVEARNH